MVEDSLIGKKYYVLMPIRNEEKLIPKTIQSVCDQTVKPQGILVIDDNSTDNTANIAKEFPLVTVVPSGLPDKNYAVMFSMWKILNVGLGYLDKKGLDYDYLLRLDGDDVLDNDYIEILLKHSKDKPLSVSVGWDPAYHKDYEHANPQGSGQLLSNQFIKLLNRNSLNQFGTEFYISAILKIHNIEFDVCPTNLHAQRKHGSSWDHNYRAFIYRGKTLRSQTAYKKYALIHIIRQKYPLKYKLSMLYGYITGNKNDYEPEIRLFAKQLEDLEMVDIYKKIFRKIFKL